MAGKLSDVRTELRSVWGSRTGVKAVVFGYPSLGEPHHLHFGLDWGASTVRDTLHSTRTWGFYARYFLPAETPENADFLYGAFWEDVLDYFDLPESERMPDGSNVVMSLRNRGGPPIRLGGERAVVRKDFYVEVQLAKNRGVPGA